MKSAVAMVTLTLVLLLAGAFAESGKARAGGLAGASSLWLSCENGGKYPVRPIAVSDEGDLVTAQLSLGRRGGLHVRLIPMGGGYRYAGRGVWFDGWRENVYLYLSKYRPIACTVVRGPEAAGG
jgi:guanyl-specific ribonuclease Sa